MKLTGFLLLVIAAPEPSTWAMGLTGVLAAVSRRALIGRSIGRTR
jgi:hypothetical protein